MGLFSKSKEEMPAPPMPPAPEENSSKLVPPTQETSTLSAPPIPGGSLADIKSQVAPSTVPAMPEMNETPKMEQPEETSEIPEVSNLEDDSLFDFSELDVEEEDENKQEIVESEPKTNLEDLSFIKQSKSKKEFETFFITTKQFKTLLEIVDSVKRKTKEANETHLRLMDIKAEEDIEYENLRKDFEFIEDKLYEVDSIIFEK